MIQVTGLHWGDYVGSPDLSTPVITWSSDRKHTAVKLATLSTGETFGLDPSSTLLFRETGNYISDSRCRARIFGSGTDLISLLILLFFLLLCFLGNGLQRSIRLRRFISDRDEIWQDCSSSKYQLLMDSDF